MKHRSRIGRQINNVLLLAIIIPIMIVGALGASLLVRQMNERYNEQIKSENTRVKSILFDITSSMYTNLEPIVSVQAYRDMLSTDKMSSADKIQYENMNRALASLKSSTAAFSSLYVYTDNPAVYSEEYVINVGTTGIEEAGDDAMEAAGSGDAGDPFSRYEWYEKIDPQAWESYTCIHVPLNEYEDSYELTLVRRFNTGSDHRAYIVVTVSNNYLRNRLITTDNYILACLSDYPVFFSSIYDEKEFQMPEAEGDNPYDYNYLGDMTIGGKTALTCVSSFVPYKVDSRFYVLIGDYEAHSVVHELLLNYVIVLILALAGPVLAIIMYSGYFTGRIYTLRQAMHKASTGDYDIIENLSGTDELSDIFNDLKLTARQIRKNEAKYYEAKIREQELVNMQQNMEFKMLSGQINPHFLYNTLEAIRMQAIRGGDRDVATSVKYLAKIMHYVLESTGRSTSTLADELKHVDSYMQIQRLRFGEKVNWNFFIEEDFRTEEYHILPLLLQPIVENAIGHGLKDMDRNGHVSVIIEHDDAGKLLITVNDDGLGMTPEEVERLNASLNEKRTDSDEKGAANIGLYNIHQRIRLYYGDEYGLSIRSQEGKGTSVALSLPAESIKAQERDRDERQEKDTNGMHE